MSLCFRVWTVPALIASVNEMNVRRIETFIYTSTASEIQEPTFLVPLSTSRRRGHVSNGTRWIKTDDGKSVHSGTERAGGGFFAKLRRKETRPERTKSREESDNDPASICAHRFRRRVWRFQFSATVAFFCLSIYLSEMMNTSRAVGKSWKTERTVGRLMTRRATCLFCWIDSFRSCGDVRIGMQENG